MLPSFLEFVPLHLFLLALTIQDLHGRNRTSQTLLIDHRITFYLVICSMQLLHMQIEQIVLHLYHGRMDGLNNHSFPHNRIGIRIVRFLHTV